MNILVAYFSQSGNTKKVADAISEELSSAGRHMITEKDIAEISPIALREFDLVFLGSACHDADLAQPVIQMLEQIDYVPEYQLAGFVTHSTTMPEGTERNQQLYTRWAGKCLGTFQRLSAEKGYDFLGFFHCQGVPIQPIAEFIHSEIITDEQEWGEYYHEVMQHPDSKDLEDAKAFAREIIRKVEQVQAA